MSARFNEAGPQGAGKPPLARAGRVRIVGASMRPARKGPENPSEWASHSSRTERFNEAGPQGAGKPFATAAASVSCRVRLQ